MTEPISRISGTKILRPRARILRTFGDELISSETVAVIELVKNAYDADATKVLIRFQKPLEVGKGKIEIIDNGHGMSLETIQTTWMEPATLFKKRQPRSEQRKRRVLGEKGIGRFAVSRLGNFLEVVTRRAGTNREVRAFFDWNQFDDEQKYLDEVESLWEEVEPTEICPGGTIKALWDDNERVETHDLNHGTVLRIEGLRTTWTESQFQSLRVGLSRLISPLSKEDQTSRDDEFHIEMSLPDPFESLSGIISPPEVLKNPHYMLKGCVEKDGRYDLTLKLRSQKDEEKLIGPALFKDGHLPRCGPFCVELRIWDRDQDVITEMAHVYGSTTQNVRRDLDVISGINIYRDGFRVLPYGEPRNDWLRLDIRRVQNPTLRLSNNQIAGYVIISADDNPELRDQSNREGIVEGPALDDLRESLKIMLSEIEQRRYNIRRSPETKQSTKFTTRSEGGLFTGFGLADVHNMVKQRHPDDTALLELVGEKEKDLERRVEEVQEVLARYRRLATLGQLIDTVLHDGRAPLSKIKTEAYLGLRDIKNTGREGDKLLLQLNRHFGVTNTQAEVLATVFREIEPFGGRKRGRPAQIRLEQVIEDTFSVLEMEIKEVGVQVSFPGTDTQVTVDQAEIQEVIINLLQNSLHWLRQVPKNNRQIEVQVHRKDSDEVEILLSDSGPGVKPEFRERIFDPYFSTKVDGVGLGLTIAGEIVSEYYGGKLELLEGGPLQGATFRIMLRRRV